MERTRIDRDPILRLTVGDADQGALHVIRIARARTSSRLTVGEYRSPPFAGPREKLCSTRGPMKTSVYPLSERNRDGHFPARRREHPPQASGAAQQVDCSRELALCVIPRPGDQMPADGWSDGHCAV